MGGGGEAHFKYTQYVRRELIFCKESEPGPQIIVGMYTGKGHHHLPRYSPSNTLLLNHFFPLLQVGYVKLNTR